MNGYDARYLDEEEKSLLEDIDGMDADKLNPPSEKEQRELRRAAREYLETEKKMNIRIDANELNKIKVQARKEGLRYQTFIKSVLHKYITGRLVEKD